MNYINKQALRELIKDVIKNDLKFEFETIDTSDNEYYSKDVIQVIKVYLDDELIHRIGYDKI